MKKIPLLLSILCLIVLWSCNDNYENVIPNSKYPEQIKTYVSTHFSTHEIKRIKESGINNTKKYEVTLDKDVELEFNGTFSIISAESKTKLPDSIIPIKILNYVKVNFPNLQILEWEYKNEVNKIEMNDGTELDFSKEGEFIKK